MNRIRLATTEEIESIKSTSDLDATCSVLALDAQSGTAFAVVRTPVEVDPVYFPENWTTRLKAMFMRDVETVLSAKGATSYYYNIKVSDTDWINAVESWGGVRTSAAEEFRFKKLL